ncbi:MAG: TlpA family protein disulfide reductase [Burkholderiales bacterium]|nr:TlpA family protein disulfide reductase [Burkholderiales bacterium]
MMPGREPTPRRWARKTAAVVAGAAGLSVGVLAALYLRTGPQLEPTVGDIPASKTLREDFPLRVWDAPRALADFAFEDERGGGVRLADSRGKVVLVNLWATWCTPCRKEMPALDRLEAKLGGPDFAVLAISIERGGAEKVRAFYGETGVTSLPIYIDAHGEASAAIRSPAIPTSVLVARDGKEIGRLYGAAEWDGPAAVDFIRQRIAASKGR